MNINFVGNRKKYYIFSGVLIVAGIISLSTKQLTPSVEFSGGRNFGIEFDKTAEGEIEYLKSNLEDVFDGASVSLKTKGSNFFVEVTTNYKLGNETANNEVKAKLEEGLENSAERLGGYRIMDQERFLLRFHLN